MKECDLVNLQTQNINYTVHLST